MRTFLRLEFLYTQATYHSEMNNSWSARAAVSSLLEILAITARAIRAWTCSRNSSATSMY